MALTRVLVLALLVPALFQQTQNPAELPVLVNVETSLGAIVIALDTLHAPLTSANFLRYIDGGFYTGGRFHRDACGQLHGEPAEPAAARVHPGRHQSGHEGARVSTGSARAHE